MISKYSPIQLPIKIEKTPLQSFKVKIQLKTTREMILVKIKKNWKRPSASLATGILAEDDYMHLLN